MNNNNVKTIHFMRVLMLTLIACISLVSCQDKTKAPHDDIVQKQDTMKKSDQHDSVLRHVVLFKFKAESSDTSIAKLNKAFNALPQEISAIKDFEWGINDSPENFHQGFTHCYLVTFDSEEARDSIYTPHPAHQAFVSSLQPHLEKVFVVDYWTRSNPNK